MTRDADSNHNVTFDCKYHVVFCTKYGRRVPAESFDARLKAVDIQAEIIEMRIMPDYAHLLIKCYPQYSIHKAVKQLKECMPKVFRDEFKLLKSRLPSLWTNILSPR